MPVSIAILGEFSAEFEPHTATDSALSHAAAALGIRLHSEWVATDSIDGALFDDHSGIWVAPGAPYKDMNKTLSAIRHARESRVPCFGTCGGFQHMVLEYARNVLNLTDAHHAEYDPYASNFSFPSWSVHLWVVKCSCD